MISAFLYVYRYWVLGILIAYSIIGILAFMHGQSIRQENRIAQKAIQLAFLDGRKSVKPIYIPQCTNTAALEWWAGTHDMKEVKTKLCK